MENQPPLLGFGKDSIALTTVANYVVNQIIFDCRASAEES